MSNGLRLVAERYRLKRALGTGGMGRVWLARDEVLRREVAVKEVIFPEEMTPAEREELFLRTLREARAAGRLSHPNVVQVYDVLEAEERPWIVMEYVPSRSLYQEVRLRGPLPPREVARIGLSVLAALSAAHQAGVLHRDVKPGNVLITEDGRVVLTDFGLATFDGGDHSVTRSGLILGSAQYIAPERARDGVSSVATDLWSLGATLYAAVEGRSPYARSTAMATLTALATAPPDPPQRAGPLRPVLIGLLRKNPRSRLTAVDAERLLRRVASGAGRGRSVEEEPEDIGAEERPLPEGPGGALVIVTPEAPMSIVDTLPRRRRRWPWLAAAAVVLVAAPGLALLLNPPGRTSADRTLTATMNPATTAVTSAPAPDAVAGAQACGRQRPDAETVVPNDVPLLPGELGLAGSLVWHREAGRVNVGALPGWGFSRVGSLLCFRERDGTRVFALDDRVQADSDLVGALGLLEGTWSAAAQLPNYERVSVHPLLFWLDSADLEYTYDGPGGVRMHGLNRLTLTRPGHAFLIYWLTKDQDWTGNTSIFQALMASLDPA